TVVRTPASEERCPLVRPRCTKSVPVEEKKDDKPSIFEPPKIETVVVHPLVLLSVVDHYNRSGKVTTGQKRVVGVLLGEQRGTTLDVSNCFAARERIVGWYHSGPKLCPSDITINELFRKYASNSVLVVVDVRRKESDGLPTEAYIAVDEVHDNAYQEVLVNCLTSSSQTRGANERWEQIVAAMKAWFEEDGSPTTKTFDRLHSQIGAEEAEEVGIEHLLRPHRLQRLVVEKLVIPSVKHKYQASLESCLSSSHSEDPNSCCTEISQTVREAGTVACGTGVHGLNRHWTSEKSVELLEARRSILPGGSYKKLGGDICRELKHSLKADREAWLMERIKEVETAFTSGNIGRLFGRMRATGPRRPSVSEATSEAGVTPTYNKSRRLKHRTEHFEGQFS
ncbi:26S proteasome regulatory subunit N8, partial [Paragonimus westermani]